MSSSSGLAPRPDGAIAPPAASSAADEIADGVSREFKQAVDRQLLARITALEAELAIAKAKLGPRADTRNASAQTDRMPEEPILDADYRKPARPGTGFIQRMFTTEGPSAGSRTDPRFPAREASKTVSEPPHLTGPVSSPQRLQPRVWAYDENGTFKLMEGEPEPSGRP